MSLQTRSALPTPQLAPARGEYNDDAVIAAQLAASEKPLPRRQRVPRLNVDVAKTLDEVTQSWRLVYEAYRRIDLIDENPFGVHLPPQAIMPHTCVITGQLEGDPVSTLSMMHDSEIGLPLDRVYNRQLNLLRRIGRPMIEVGLFADRHEKVGKALAAIMEMMRFVFWHAFHLDADLVCGVHPRHADFYVRTFGFHVIGPVQRYATVNDELVIPLLVTPRDQPLRNPIPRGVALFIENELSPEIFEQRFRLSPDVVEGTDIGDYLRYRGLLDVTGMPVAPSAHPISRPMSDMLLDDEGAMLAA